MKKFLSILLCAGLVFCMLLTGCGGGDTPDTPDSPTKDDTASTDAAADLSKQRNSALETIRKEYTDKIDATDLNKLIGRQKSSTDLDSKLENSEDEYLDAVRAIFDETLPFITEGSLIGPEAPTTYDEACAYIKEEFKDNTADDTSALDEALATMKESYDSDAQKAFDTARRALWDKYECTVETNTYFKDHA